MMNWERLLAPLEQTKKGGAQRTEFERDFDRIVFSAPFRSLQDKTQVFPLPENDFVHTRLTHSLEVSSVGRSLGKAAGEYLLRKYPSLAKVNISSTDVGAIVAAAALTHDIGNPPFGHAGEEAISDFFKLHEYGKIWKAHLLPEQWTDMINFEGNAQGFRMLVDKDNGLLLSGPTLAAFTKYPRASAVSRTDPSKRSQKKYGVFQDQTVYYNNLATTLGIPALGDNVWCRHPLAFLVEAADDICYNIIDLEDGCSLGLVSFEETVDLLASIIGQKFSAKKLNSLNTKGQKLAILRAMTINQLIEESVVAFKENEEKMLSGEFDQSLTEVIPSAPKMEKISKLSVKKIYRSQPVLEKEAAGYQVLEGLLEVFSKAIYHRFYQPDLFSGQDKSILRLLPEYFPNEKMTPTTNPYPVLRQLIDYISGMTDKYGLSLYRRVKGISLPGV